MSRLKDLNKLLESELEFGTSTPNWDPEFLIQSIFKDICDETGFMSYGNHTHKEGETAFGTMNLGWNEPPADGGGGEMGLRVMMIVDPENIAVTVHDVNTDIDDPEAEGYMLKVDRGLGGYVDFLREVVDFLRKTMGGIPQEYTAPPPTQPEELPPQQADFAPAAESEEFDATVLLGEENLDEAKKLTPKMMKKGLRIIRTAHPEWGVWVVEGPTKGVSGMWDLEKADGRGGKVLDAGNLDAWELAK